MPRPALDLDCSTVTPVDLGEDIWGQIRNQRVLISRYRNYQKKIVTLTSISGSSLSSICKHSIVTSGRGRRLLFFCTLLVSSECLSSSAPVEQMSIELWHFPTFFLNSPPGPIELSTCRANVYRALTLSIFFTHGVHRALTLSIFFTHGAHRALTLSAFLSSYRLSYRAIVWLHPTIN